MHPIKQLQQLLTKKVASSGTVIRTEGTSIFVATEKGIQVVNRVGNDATVYREGETVQFANGQALGKRRAPKRVYIR